jgi:hypothetical protein
MDTCSEKTLLARIRHGDDSGFEALVAAHSPRVLALAWRLVGDRQDAEDIAQEAFLRFHRPLGPALGWSLAAATAALLLLTLHSPTPPPQQPPAEVALQTDGEMERLPEPELLLDLELLENLDLLQELEGTGISG